MFKRIVLGVAALALVATAYAFGVVKYSSVAGTRVLSTTPVKVERIIITKSTGSAILGVYNATSATGAVAVNKVLDITATAATENLVIELNGTLTKGLVISSAGNPETVTASVVIQPNN